MDEVFAFVEAHDIDIPEAEEICFPIRNFDNYEISNLENIRKKSSGLVLKQSLDRNGVRMVTLNQNVIRKKHYVWYLVFIAIMGDHLN
jgi:hypothetical protein